MIIYNVLVDPRPALKLVKRGVLEYLYRFVAVAQPQEW
jgi:hypothetical protein